MEGQAQRSRRQAGSPQTTSIFPNAISPPSSASRHADVQRVAREYLTPENRTLYALLPNGATPKISTNIEINSDQPVQKFELPNGLRLLVKENHRLPFVEFRAAFKGGVLAETAAEQRHHAIARQDAVKGTKTRAAQRKSRREIESVGGSIDSYGGNNSFGVNAEVLSERFRNRPRTCSLTFC